MTTSLTEFFDAYSLRARLQPGFLAVFPIVVTIYVLWDPPGLEKLWPIFVAAGGTFFLANLVRSRGLTAEGRLIQQWDGLPTTRALRSRTVGNAVMRDRRRTQIHAVTGLSLPSQDEELADPRAADQIYEAATRVLIIKVRQRSDVFPLVQEANINYGFRRNLYALKPLALGLVALAMVGCIVIGVRQGVTSNVIIAATVDVLALLAWILVITPDWVLQVGERYAERLLETLENPSLAP
jgi:hypothetical protein